MDATFEGAARALKRGEIDFEEFVRRTSRWVERKSAWLMRKSGATPGWLAIEDVEQTIRMHLWRAFLCYDAGRAEGATTIDRYLSFSATKTTHKMIKRAQAVNQHTRSGPSAFELLGSEDTISREVDLGLEAEAESELVRRQCYEVLRGLCDSLEERRAIDALEKGGGDLWAAAGELWEDRDARLDCEVVCEDHAASVIKRTVRRLVRDYGRQQATEVAA